MTLRIFNEAKVMDPLPGKRRCQSLSFSDLLPWDFINLSKEGDRDNDGSLFKENQNKKRQCGLF